MGNVRVKGSYIHGNKRGIFWNGQIFHFLQVVGSIFDVWWKVFKRYYRLLEENGKFGHSRKYHACYHGCNFPLHEHSPWWRNCRMQKNMGTTNRSRTSDRMFSRDAYTSSKKQQFYFWRKSLSSNKWDSYGNQNGTLLCQHFYGDLEERLLLSSLKQPLSWFRFIDDVDMKWTHGDKELDEFLEHANSIHPSIKFTHEVSKTKMSFLDTTTTVKEGNMTTDLYSKPTDKHQYLSPSSCHPKHCFKSIPFSQAIRVKRICSTVETTKQRLGDLRHHLKKRGYNDKVIESGFSKASEINRNDLLEYKEKKINKRVPLVLTYHPSLAKIAGIVRHHWKEIEKSETLVKLFPEPPVVAFRRPKSIKDTLVRAAVSRPSSTVGQCKPCGDKRCKCCLQLQHTQVFHSKTTGKEYKIFCNVNCKTPNVVYLLDCHVCGSQYVGESVQPFNKRMNGHRSDLTKKTLLPVSQHFVSPGHSLEDFGRSKIYIIDHNPSWKENQRQKKESFWIRELQTLHPEGINKKA